MALHPGEQKRPVPEKLSVAPDPIRRGLIENEDWYRDLVEHSHDLLCIHDLQGRLLSVNPVPARLLGYSVSELLQIPMRDFIDPKFRPQFDDYLREVERTGESQGVIAVMTRAGERRFWEYSNTLRTEGVEAPVVRGIAHDVTDRVRVEKTLRKKNDEMAQKVREQEAVVRELKLFRTLLDHSNDAIEVIDAETMRLLDVNEKLVADLGYSREELLSMTVYDVAPHVTHDSIARVTEQLRKSGYVTLEGVHRRKDGTTFPVEVNVTRVQLDREYMLSMTRDITQRKRAAELLEESEKRFRAVYEGAPVGICLIETSTGRFLRANPRYCEITGRTEQDLLNRDFCSITHPDDVMANRTNAIRLAKGDLSSYEIEKRYVRPDGSIRWVNVTAVSLPGDGASTPWSIAIVQDITERRQAQQALRESEARERSRVKELETILDTLPIPVLIAHDRDCRKMTANRAGREHLHLKPGANASLSAPPAEKPPHRVLLNGGEVPVQHLPMQLAAATGFPVLQSASKVILEDGTERYELGNAAPLLDDEGRVRGAVGAAIDITDRVLAEQALQESEERLRLAQEVARIGTFERNLQTGESRWSPEMEAMYGLAPGKFPRSIEAFLKLVHEADRPSVARLVEQSMQSGDVEGEWRVVWSDGTVHWIAGRWRAFKDQHSRPLRILGMDFDITDRKRTEEALRQSEERFRVALKNSPIAVFTQDRDLRLTWVYNSRLPQPISETLGKTMDQLFATEEAAEMTELRRRVLETGVGSHHELQISLGGRKRYFDTTIEPLFDPAGKVVGITGASTDVTELRETTEDLREAKKKLAEEKLYLEREIDTELGFGEIIGQSRPVQRVMELVGNVASSDATVLLLGETGTGKELVARAIHRLSQRANSSFIKMNCAAIPTGLLESELFGNEKGAFTGAISRKLGRLELADKGTLFLDEIGEISLALQPKLLRVLQDHEFERLGGTRTINVDFRLIAATNRDLADSVLEKQFRSDLYYRLNVFPIRVPPLRERRDDIPLLVEHFVRKFAQRMKKPITSVPKKTMDALQVWQWPGNIRELENFIERSVILTHGSVLVVPLSELQSIAPGETVMDETLEAAEREHILRALRESHGQISGLHGAAKRLGMKRTTLQSRMKRLGISSRPETK